MQNFIYFVPCAIPAEGNTPFLVADHTDELTYTVKNTESELVDLIKETFLQTEKKIVIDTALPVGRDLLAAVVPMLTEAYRLRLFSSEAGYDYHALAKEPQTDENVDMLVRHLDYSPLFGGKRKITEIDLLTLRAYKQEEMDDALAEVLKDHPVAKYLRLLIQEVHERDTRMYTQQARKTVDFEREYILPMTHAVCQIIQAPFPIYDSQHVSEENPYVLVDLLMRRRYPVQRESDRFYGEEDANQLMCAAFPARTPEDLNKETEIGWLVNKENKPLWRFGQKLKRFGRAVIGTLDKTDGFFNFTLGFCFGGMSCSPSQLIEGCLVVWLETLVIPYSDDTIFLEKFHVPEAREFLDQVKAMIRGYAHVHVPMTGDEMCKIMFGMTPKEIEEFFKKYPEGTMCPELYKQKDKRDEEGEEWKNR